MWGFFRARGRSSPNTFQPFMIKHFRRRPGARRDLSAGPPPSYILSLVQRPRSFSRSWCCPSSPRSRFDVFKGRVPPGAEGSRLWRRLHHLGSGPQQSSFPTPASAVIGGNHGWRSAARSAKPCGDPSSSAIRSASSGSIFAPGHHDLGGDRLRIRRKRRACTSRGLNPCFGLLLFVLDLLRSRPPGPADCSCGLEKEKKAGN